MACWGCPFSDPVTREYVSEQLGGRLDVATNHDAIDVTISGRANELERIVDFLRGALVTPQITPENVIKIRRRGLGNFPSGQTQHPKMLIEK